MEKGSYDLGTSYEKRCGILHSYGVFVFISGGCFNTHGINAISQFLTFQRRFLY